MKGVAISITQQTATVFALSLYFPNEYASFLGEFVRPEGTIAKGLILHANSAGIRGVSYSVQPPTSAGGKLAIQLPISYTGVPVTSPKGMTELIAEGETVDGRSIVVFDKFDIGTMFDRTPRKRNKKLVAPEPEPVPLPIHLNRSDLDKVKDAIRFIRTCRARSTDLNEAVVTLVKLASKVGVALSTVDGALEATVRRDLFGEG